MSFTEEDDIDAELKQIYEDRMEYFRREYQCAIDSYVTAANIDIGLLRNAYGGLDFFFNKCIQNKAYNDIYKKIHKFRNCLFAESYHYLRKMKNNVVFLHSVDMRTGTNF